jgi:hypothetical protein
MAIILGHIETHLVLEIKFFIDFNDIFQFF